MIFLLVDLEAAVADAGLGRVGEALERLEALIARHTPSGHPLTLGLLHDARARIAHAAGLHEAREESTREAARWLRPTGTPSLLAICDQLQALVARESVGDGDDPVAWNEEDLRTQTAVDNPSLLRGS